MALVIRRHRPKLISGPILIGFAELFERAYGDERTPRPYPRIKPVRIGGVLLPFACPNCDEVRPEVVDAKRWTNYADKRGHSWCPACKTRYVIDGKGTPPVEPIAVGATHAPAIIERKGKVSVLGAADGFKFLGASS